MFLSLNNCIVLFSLVGTVLGSTTAACNNANIDFGSCPDPTINITNDEQNEILLYAPANTAAFHFDPSTDLASIESSICYQLESGTCNASLAAINLCWEVFWLYSGLAGDNGALVWNQSMGGSSDCPATTRTIETESQPTSAVTQLTLTFTTTLTVETPHTASPSSSRTHSPASNTLRESPSTYQNTATITDTATSAVAHSSSPSSSATSASDPFSMNGTPFIDNASSRTAIGPAVAITVLALISVFLTLLGGST